jgi:hypothetical protein
MADHRFHVVVDLVGNTPTKIDALLMKGREHNHTSSGKGFVRNSRDYEWGYTLHKDAVRAARRFWRLLGVHNERHAAVYIRDGSGRLEPVWSHGEMSESPSATSSKTWLESLVASLTAFRKVAR